VAGLSRKRECGIVAVCDVRHIESGEICRNLNAFETLPTMQIKRRVAVSIVRNDAIKRCIYCGVLFVLPSIGPTLAADHAEFEIKIYERPGGQPLSTDKTLKYLHIKYKGDSEITIKEVKINRDTSCFMTSGAFITAGEKKFPFQMKFGDNAEWIITCNPIEVSIGTDRGDVVYGK
jgi:hypothetical protein